MLFVYIFHVPFNFALVAYIHYILIILDYQFLYLHVVVFCISIATMYVHYIAVYFPFLGCMYMPVCMQDSGRSAPYMG